LVFFPFSSKNRFILLLGLERTLQKGVKVKKVKQKRRNKEVTKNSSKEDEVIEEV